MIKKHGGRVKDGGGVRTKEREDGGRVKDEGWGEDG